MPVPDVVACVLLGVFLVCQRLMRRGEQARSLQSLPVDRGSTRFLGVAFLLGVLGLIAGPLLNAYGLGEASPAPFLGWLGVAVMVLGLALRLWAQAVLGRHYTTTLRHADDQQVLTAGPYRLLRHPGYAGMLVAWVGAGLATANWAVASANTLFMLVAYGYRIAVEEAMMLGAFGGRYQEYKARTWRLIPFIY
jgi:protein-S-isoprenylcysteine O-methyltransferase Ste14